MKRLGALHAMILTQKDFIKLTLTFICLAAPSIAQGYGGRQVGYRNPFLPSERSFEIIPSISWTQSTRSERSNPFLSERTTTITETPVSNNTIPHHLPTVEDGCGRIFVGPTAYVQGGAPARQHDWPFIALLGYGESPYTEYKCGGTLITARHVLTAAHCIRSDLILVRLGEHDLSTETDTQHQDVPVVKTVKHPQYNRRNGRSDIAMLYLERNVEFTTKIRPICMPSSVSLRSKSYVGTVSTIAGWGKLKENGTTPTVLNELKIPVLENEVCRSSYARVNRHFTQDQFDDAVICAGVLTGGKDSCYGDSGGPLIIQEDVSNEYPKERYYLIGIVAYGLGCAKPGIPGVYTSTQYFLDWVLEKLKDTL